MERLENPFTIPLLICGMIFFVVGLLLLFFPPKKINSLYGYRTPNSMKSQERWDFSQKYSSNLMWKCGVGIALLSLLESGRLPVSLESAVSQSKINIIQLTYHISKVP